MIQKQWTPHLKVVFHFYFGGRGQFSFHFQLNNNQDCVFHNGPWFMSFYGIYLSSWSLYFDPKEEVQQISPFRSTSLTFLSSPRTPKPWRQLQTLQGNVFTESRLMLVCMLVLVFQFKRLQKRLCCRQITRPIFRSYIMIIFHLNVWVSMNMGILQKTSH